MGIGSKIAKVVRLDSWSNLLSGLGMAGKDKRVEISWSYDKMAEGEVETLYASDDIAARIVDELPEDALREWIEMKNLEPVMEDSMTEKLDAIMARERFEEGWKWGRMYGGAGLYMNVNDGMNPDEPVNEDNIQDVTSLTVLSRYELVPYQINSDIESPHFGEPTIYRLQTSQPTDFVQRYIHRTRILRFDGARLPRRLRIQNQWWGQSVFEKSLNAIKNYHTSNDSSVAALADFSTGVFKIKNLAELLASGQEAAVRQRIEIANLSKSVIRAMVIDQDEEFTHVTRNLTGVKDIVEQSNSRLVTAAKMPHNKLLGDGPDGGALSGGGDQETRDWYDYVRNQQKLLLKPRLDILMRYIWLSKRGPSKGKEPVKWSYEFVPLWQMSDGEKADVRLKTSQADASDIQNGILDPNEVAQSRYGGDIYSTDTVLDDKLRTEGIGLTTPDNGADNANVEPGTAPNTLDGPKTPAPPASATPNPGYVPDPSDTKVTKEK